MSAVIQLPAVDGVRARHAAEDGAVDRREHRRGQASGAPEANTRATSSHGKGDVIIAWQRHYKATSREFMPWFIACAFCVVVQERKKAIRAAMRRVKEAKKKKPAAADKVREFAVN